MARVKLSAIFTSLRGRYGGGVFRNHRGTTTLASLQSSRREYHTFHQVKQRELLGVCSKGWSSLTVSEKDEWAEVAAYLSIRWGIFKNEVGSNSLIRTPRGPFTAIDAFISSHCLLGSTNLWRTGDPFIAAPVGVTAPSQATELVATKSLIRIAVSWVSPTSWGINGSVGWLRIWAKSENGTFYTQIARTRNPAQTTLRIDLMRPRGGGSWMPLVPGAYLVQMDAVSLEGLVSAPSNIARVVI